MDLGIGGGPHHQSETARIAQAQDQTVAQLQIDMIVLLRRRAHGHQAQAAGHAEVNDEGAAAGGQQQILAAPSRI